MNEPQRNRKSQAPSASYGSRAKQRKDRLSFKRIVYLLIIAAVLLLIVLKFDSFSQIIAKIFSLMSPLWLAIIFYYVFNRPAKFFARHLSKLRFFQKKKRAYNLSLTLVYLIFIAVVILLLLTVIPSLQESVTELFSNYKNYSRSLEDWLSQVVERWNADKLDLSFIDKMRDYLSKTVNNFARQGVSYARGFVSSTVSFCVNMVIGLILSAYLLTGQDWLRKGFNRIINTRSEAKAKRAHHVAELVDHTFSTYFYVQVTEAIILASLCFLGFSILQIPYTIVLAFLIFALALIPVVGAWVAGILGFVMVLFVEPPKAISFLFSYVFIQFFEGQIIYPRRVNSGIGLPSVFVIVIVLVTGGLLGIWGALLGVPVASIIYTLAEEKISEKEAARELKNSQETLP